MKCHLKKALHRCVLSSSSDRPEVCFVSPKLQQKGPTIHRQDVHEAMVA